MIDFYPPIPEENTELRERVTRAADLYCGGMTLVQVAEAMGISKSSAANYVGRAGIRRRPYKSPPREKKP